MQKIAWRIGRRHSYKMQRSLSFPWNGNAAIDMHRSDDISVGDNVFFSNAKDNESRRKSYKAEACRYMEKHRTSEKPVTPSGISAGGICVVAIALALLLAFTACCGAQRVRNAGQQVANIEMTLESAKARNKQLNREVAESQADMVVLKKVIDESQMISSKGVTPEYLCVSMDSVIKPNAGSTGESLFAVIQLK